MRLVIVSGRSGSGKTIALHALEDLGFYCIDNLPFLLVPELQGQLGSTHPTVAVSVDARNYPSNSLQFKNVIKDLNQTKNKCEIVYLDADENTLLKRFSETRRKHPLSNSSISLREAIQKELEILAPIASLADLIVDTSLLTRQGLYNIIRDRIAHHHEGKIQLLLQSFGFKHGLPPDADFVFDVRCLPNPYWEPELSALNGLDHLVIQYLEKIPEANRLIKDISTFIENWIPYFEADNRSYVTIAIGCTGGQHRSVYMVESLSALIKDKIQNTQTRHRELKLPC